LTVQSHPVSYWDLIKTNGNFRDLWFGQIVSMMGALMLTFGVNWFVNGVWEMRKAAIPASVE